MYKIIYSPRARRDLDYWEKRSKTDYKRLLRLIEEIAQNPREGIGKIEPLKGIKNGWSRRLTQRDRIKYIIFDKHVYVYVISARGHYDDH